MPQFLDPFPGVIPGRKMTEAELVRALRLNLSAEQEAVHLYLSHADATDNELAKAVLRSIADEERVHVGEFLRLISILAPDEPQLLAEGAGEVNAMANQAKAGGTASSGQPGAPVPTVGDLKK